MQLAFFRLTSVHMIVSLFPFEWSWVSVESQSHKPREPLPGFVEQYYAICSIYTCLHMIKPKTASIRRWPQMSCLPIFGARQCELLQELSYSYFEIADSLARKERA